MKVLSRVDVLFPLGFMVAASGVLVYLAAAQLSTGAGEEGQWGVHLRFSYFYDAIVDDELERLQGELKLELVELGYPCEISVDENELVLVSSRPGFAASAADVLAQYALPEPSLGEVVRVDLWPYIGQIYLRSDQLAAEQARASLEALGYEGQGSVLAQEGVVEVEIAGISMEQAEGAVPVFEKPAQLRMAFPIDVDEEREILAPIAAQLGGDGGVRWTKQGLVTEDRYGAGGELERSGDAILGEQLAPFAASLPAGLVFVYEAISWDGPVRWRARLTRPSEGIEGERIAQVFLATMESGGFYVALTLDHEGSARFGRQSAEHIGESCFIMLDGETLVAPRISDEVWDGNLSVSLGAVADSAQAHRDLVLQLERGARPIDLSLMSLEAKVLR